MELEPAGTEMSIAIKLCKCLREISDMYFQEVPLASDRASLTDTGGGRQGDFLQR